MKAGEKRDSTDRNTQHEVSSARRGYVLALLTIIWTLSYMDRSIFGVVIQPIKKEFVLSDTMMGLMTGFGFTLVYLILSLPVSRYADRKSRVPLLAAGLVVWSAMTALGGIARSAWQVFVYRMGVGVGESTSLSPAISLIGDYFPKEKRAMATSIFGIAPNLGLALGIMAGGFVAHYYGWRMAFYVAGIPGLIVAAIFYLTVKEPARGLADGRLADTADYNLGDTSRFLARNKTFILLMWGQAMFSLSGISFGIWNVPFLIRVHHLNMAQIGGWLGTVSLLGVPGALLGGFITTVVSKQNDRWKIIVPGLALLLMAPAIFIYLFTGSMPVLWTSLLALIILMGMPTPLLAALIPTVAKVRMRALGTALYFMAGNLFGWGLGPLFIGMMNDALGRSLGQGAIRYSMLISVAAALVGGLGTMWGARYVEGDIKRAAAEGLGAGPATRVPSSKPA